MPPLLIHSTGRPKEQGLLSLIIIFLPLVGAAQAEVLYVHIRASPEGEVDLGYVGCVVIKS